MALGQELNVFFTCGYSKLRLGPWGKSYCWCLLLPGGQNLKGCGVGVEGIGSDILRGNRKGSETGNCREKENISPSPYGTSILPLKLVFDFGCV